VNNKIWKIAGPLAFLGIIALTGCVSKTKAKSEAMAAFAAGQQEALRRTQQLQGQTLAVTVFGAVRHSAVPWTPNLTLSQAVIAADYYGRKDPSRIVIVRRGIAIPLDPKQLLSGNDTALEPGDIVQIEEGRLPQVP
jgi:hypothetical protein